MNRRNLLLIPVAIPALWAFTAPADEVHFHIAEGTTLNSAFDTTVELSLDEMRIVSNGEEQDASMFGLEIDMSNITSLHFTDQYVHVKDGRPTEFVRTYETLSNSVETSQANAVTGSMDSTVLSDSELEDSAVRFTWDSEEQAYVVNFADEDSGGDEELLENLTARADLLEFLPESGVARGDTWEVDVDVILLLMAPGGDVKLVPLDLEDSPMGQDPMADVSFSEMMGDIEGEISAEYMGLTEIDGVSFASLKITISVNSANDLTDMLQETASEMGQEGVDIRFDAVDVEMAIEGEGSLLWDVKGGHFASFELSADLEQIMDMSMSLQTPMGNMEMEQTISMSGSMEFDFSATRE